MTTKNTIPRHFIRLTVKMLVDTSCSVAGDILHVYKNDCGYLVLNMRTNKYAYAFPAMLRNGAVCNVLEVLQ